MARKRIKQRQSARMYYRDKDHRDVIYNDKYINSLFIEYNSNRPDWREYKHHLVLGSMYGKKGSGSASMYPVSIDVDNRYISFGSNYSTSDIFDSNVMAHSDTFALVGEYITTNGHDYYRYYFDEDPSKKEGIGIAVNKMCGDDMVAYISFDSNTCKTYVHFYRFKEFGYKEIIDYGQWTPDHPFTRWGHLLEYVDTKDLCPYTSSYPSLAQPEYQGRSKNGIFLSYSKPRSSTTEQWEEKLFEVTLDGSTLLHTFTTEGSGTSTQKTTFCNGHILYDGAKYCIVHSYSTTSTPKMEGVYVYWANASAPTVWSQTIVVPQENYLGSGIGVCLCHRNNVWYLYCSNLVTTKTTSKIRFRLFKSTNLSSWSSVTLPAYLDVPVLENDGTHGDIDNCQYSKIRLILNSIDNTIPTEDGTYNTDFSAPSTIGGYQADFPFGTMFGDGQPYITSPIDFSVGGVQYNRKDYSRKYDKFIYWNLDNMECKSTDGNFAFCPPDLLIHKNGEVIQESDYVFGTSEESEV